MRVTAAPRKYPEELRERAIRMAADLRRDPATRQGVLARVGEQLGINPETLRNWVTQAEADAGDRPGTTTSDAQRLADPPALGLSVALALASFAVPWLTSVGVVLGAVVLPVVIEAAARRTSGAAPLGDYLGPRTRGTVLASLAVAVLVTAAALFLLKVTGAVGGVLVGAVVISVVTAWCTRWVSRQRLTEGAGR
ncbi:transposase [Georgenia sp. 311]|uniref:transposase n=1 Tax=Georgenia sp. 311 TaxID=2585134 RepID=UPI001111F505|nr:transposase [Georgenia sp. 311]TNC17204.1 transposase [Georgenia sp. 311]